VKTSADYNKMKAYQYYTGYILDEDKRALYEKYNFSNNGTVSSHDWELFVAILLNKKKKQKGPDLEGYEVKSARRGNSFEYQYHKDSGLEKMIEDGRVNHIFISYDNQYKDITVREMDSDLISQKISGWEKDFVSNYRNGKQRYRKSLSYKFVCENSKVIVEIQNGVEV